MRSATNQLTTTPVTNFIPLEQVTQPTVPTAAAAHYLNRKPQTLRIWACMELGPIRPVRIFGRLAWRVADIRALLAGDAISCKSK